MPPMTMTAENLLAAADDINDLLEPLLLRARVKDSGEARVAMCLYLTIAELYGAALAVYKSQYQSHAPVLIRSMLESLADLLILVTDASHLDQMNFENARQMLNVVKAFEGDVDLQKDADAMMTMKSWRDREQPIYESLKTKGVKPKSILDTFRTAGISREYAGYRFLCSFTHVNINALITRHAGVGHLRFTYDMPLETLRSTLGMAISLYGRAVETLPSYTDIAQIDVVAAINAVDTRWENFEPMRIEPRR